MLIFDVVVYVGEKYGGVKLVNFLDIGGGVLVEVMVVGLDVVLGDQQVKSVFVNVFGGIILCDVVVIGIVKVLGMLGDEVNKLLVVWFDGNNVEEGCCILIEVNYFLVILVVMMDEVVDKVVELVSV